MNKPYVYKRADDLGIPVVEGKSRKFVTVMTDDVVVAKKADSKHCALARASLRLPEVVAAYFFRKTAFLEYGDKMVRFHLPQSVQKEIVSFDRAQVFAEGVYQLTPPPPSSTRNGKVAGNRRRATGKVRPFKPLTKREQADLSAAKRVAAGPKKHIGDRTVSGIKSAKAPEPLPSKAPTKYVHRTKYVRDLREPA